MTEADAPCAAAAARVRRQGSRATRALAPAAAKGLSIRVLKKKSVPERQHPMTDQSPSHAIKQNTEAVTVITVTPDQRAALTSLLVNAIMDTGSNRTAALYRAILTELSQLSPRGIEITDEMALAGAKTLAATIRMTWDGLPPGKVDPRFPAWAHGGHANAHQDDYIDLSHAILGAALAARTES